ncbi:hypothetical protein QQS21_008854 [Conoideocrella luteorostrata]|uniref:Uncharacterized protein n=1 Tax=Conoideocrella luteorostrata TaxID=1105319 RepID=A0AAJ0CKS8_9HYPO|nr:hypothetical protein QQS21_008854 [Conoideocrella luteorostrata]
MPKRRLSESIPEALPLCDGPKLGLFPHHDAARIQWLERLDVGDDGRRISSEGCVYRAVIHGREYAIKVVGRPRENAPLPRYMETNCGHAFRFSDLVQFFQPYEHGIFLGALLGRDTPLDTAAFYTDPFYRECRAYGRIHEAIRRRELKADVAVACHGYFFLQTKDQQILNNHNIDLRLDMVDLDYQSATIGGCRPRAIVKDLASSDSGVTGKNLGRLLHNLSRLNRAGVYNSDIHLNNYKDGKIIDFGSSWTEPNPLLDAWGKITNWLEKMGDRIRFDEMVTKEGIPNPKKVKARHSMTLRSTTKLLAK